MVGGTGDAVTEVVEEGGGDGAVASEGGVVEDESRWADNASLCGGVEDSRSIARDAVVEVIDVGGTGRAGA